MKDMITFLHSTLCDWIFGSCKGNLTRETISGKVETNDKRDVSPLQNENFPHLRAENVYVYVSSGIIQLDMGQSTG